ncbi:hypothetical protein [Synechocystis sp. PCC 7509]|nr:hypothetical protein [Synechocystis sp. PCC 7509]
MTINNVPGSTDSVFFWSLGIVAKNYLDYYFFHGNLVPISVAADNSR